MTLNINYEKRFIQEYETPTAPKGFVLKMIIKSTWGDRHFVGLNGLDVFDSEGTSLIAGQSKFKLKVSPPSVNVLPGYEKDVRTPEKLVNGQNETFNDGDMWLAPLITDLERLEKHIQNTIVIEFGHSISLGAINFYNYTKTPSRGVREIEILLDETLVFMVVDVLFRDISGRVPAAMIHNQSSRRASPSAGSPSFYDRSATTTTTKIPCSRKWRWSTKEQS